MKEKQFFFKFAKENIKYRELAIFSYVCVELKMYGAQFLISLFRKFGKSSKLKFHVSENMEN